MFAFAGDRIEPEVSVPTFAAQKLIAVPMPDAKDLSTSQVMQPLPPRPKLEL